MAVGLFVSFITVTPAKASQIANSDAVTQALDAITQLDGSLLDGAAQIPENNEGALTISGHIGDVQVSIPVDPSQDLSLVAEGQRAVTIGLPFGDHAVNASSTKKGVATYENDSLSVAVVRDDGSLQINTVINSPEAPARYEYTFGLSKGTTIKPAGEGVLFMNDGTFVGGLALAWARDAKGRSVPTRYEINGEKISQIVEHNSNFSYPIVADPWIGMNIFRSITVDSYSGQPRVNLDLSVWGWGIWAGSAGQVILNTAGWDEAVTKSSTVRAALNKPSQRQQFECHALGAPFAGTWNLEKFRVNRTNGFWWTALARHRCNWTTADAQ